MARTAVLCPNCGGPHLTAITYAYHSLFQDQHLGVQFNHEEWSDEFALKCWDCDWTYGDPACPRDIGSVDAVIRHARVESTDEMLEELIIERPYGEDLPDDDF